MRLPSFIRHCGTLLSIPVLFVGLQTTVCAQFGSSPLTHSGKVVFEREFQPDNDDATEGDGLGPVFNANSCVKCHNQGGVGGGGDNSVNVQILSIIPPTRKLTRDQQNRFRAHLNEIHPDLANTGSVILHLKGTNRQYALWRDQILGLEFDDPTRNMSKSVRKRRMESISRQGTVIRLPEFRGMNFMLTQRNTSSLLGTRLIDSIPDEVIEEMAAAQAQLKNGISGQVSRLAVPGSDKTQVGKFGWRGQIATLDEFVLAACSAEMGLQVRGNPQPIDPTVRGVRTVVVTGDAEEGSIPADISDADLEKLVSFVRVLPPPSQRVPTAPDALTLALAGRTQFNSLNCAQCHTPTLGIVNGIFSDLLLHDMGESLEDPLPTPGLNGPTLIGKATRPGGGYYGGPVELFVNITDKEIFRSWRTPPLWGVRDTAPYMHDGRAATLHDAVLAHDGEALDSARNYANLARRDQQALIAFLQAIGSPDQ